MLSPDTLWVLFLCRFFEICRMCNWHLQISQDVHKQEPKSVCLTQQQDVYGAAPDTSCSGQNRHSQERRRRTRRSKAALLYCLQQKTRCCWPYGGVWWWCQILAFTSQVDRPITDRLPIYDRTFINIFIICAWFWVIQNVMGARPQALEIIFQVQRKKE